MCPTIPGNIWVNNANCNYPVLRVEYQQQDSNHEQHRSSFALASPSHSRQHAHLS